MIASTARQQSCPVRQYQGNREKVRWREQLPAEWAGQVVAPVFFSRFREYEIYSERVVGYEDDSENEPCYCEHYFVLTDLCSDDDEIYELVPSYWEHLIAWRLRDGRWLINRRIACSEDCQSAQMFFTFAEDMPR